MANVIHCPSLEELETFLADSDDVEIGDAVEQHIETCERCRDQLVDLRENLDLVTRLRSSFLQRNGHIAAGDPKSVGHYRVIKTLGTGGMGVVYLAEQEQPQRLVAVKVMRADAMRSTTAGRLSDESNLLGRLQHPAIAQVFEAGMADVVRNEGNVTRESFIAMEYIAGVRVDEFVKQRQLTLNQRLQLIARIADGVHHAHLKGVIHRDIKPGNILVTAAEAHSSSDRNTETGDPKILDFGIASLHDGTETDTSPGQTNRLAGTLPYMSPEQLSRDELQIDARTDVYSLGVMTYRILCEHWPFDIVDKPAIDVAKEIQNGTPTPLRERNPRIPRDVETMVMTAMARDPEKRYSSAAQFAADIRSCLDRRPISCRPLNPTVQALYFIRRNRLLVSVVALAFVGMLGLSIAAVRSAGDAGRSAQLARNEAARANEEAARANAEMNRANNALKDSERRYQYARESADFLLNGIGRRLSAVSGAAAIQRAITEEVCVYYQRLADERPDDLSVQRDAWHSKGELGIGQLLIGNRIRAKQLIDDAHEAMNRAHQQDPDSITLKQELAASLGKIAWVATESGQFAEAVTAYEHQVALMNEIVDRDPENRSVRRRLAMVHRLFGKTLTRTFACQQSKEQLERARIICDSLLDETPMNPYFLREQALVSVAYGQLAESINEPSEAKRHYEKAFTQINLAIDRVPNHPMYMSVKAEVLRTLSYSCLMQGMMTDSYEFATQARIMISQLIRGDPENVPWRRNLAAILEILAITSFQLDIPGAEDLAELCKDHFRTIAEAPEASWPEKCDYARVLLTIEPAFLQDPTAAMKLLQPDQGSRPENDPVYQFHMAATLHANGNTEEAIFLWDQARNSLPENSLISAESWAEKLRFPQDSP